MRLRQLAIGMPVTASMRNITRAELARFLGMTAHDLPVNSLGFVLLAATHIQEAQHTLPELTNLYQLLGFDTKMLMGLGESLRAARIELAAAVGSPQFSRRFPRVAYRHPETARTLALLRKCTDTLGSAALMLRRERFASTGVAALAVSQLTALTAPQRQHLRNLIALHQPEVLRRVSSGIRDVHDATRNLVAALRTVY